MKQLWMDWQTFAEAAEAGQETGGETGGQAAPDAGEQQVPAGEQGVPGGEEDFETLIRGRYKGEFDARVRRILDGRLRGLRQENARLQEKIAQVRLVSRAKCCLIEREGMTEADAHRLIEKRAMDTRMSRGEVAQEILEDEE